MLILQTNLNRSKVAHELLEQTIKEKNIDLVVIAEPNKKIVEDESWFTDTNKDAAVKICKQSTETKIRGIVRKSGIVLIELNKINVCCGYISPNILLGQFLEYLQELTITIGYGRKPVILAGDFNSKSRTWGSKHTDRKGQLLEELISAQQMIIANTGTKPTFSRGAHISYLDITAYSENLAGKVANWTVLDDENLSDHKYITYEILPRCEEKRYANDKKKWNINKEKIKELPLNIEMILWNKGDTQIDTPEKLEAVIAEACDKTFDNRKRNKKGYKPKYWWNKHIAEKRKECEAINRKIIRENRKTHKQDNRESKEKIVELKKHYKLTKKELGKMIMESKEKAWKKLKNDLENDIWGLAYQIVTKKMNRMKRAMLDTQEQIKIARDLFPECAKVQWKTDEQKFSAEEFSLNELQTAATKLKDGKAPGLDQIPNEVVKIAVKVIPEVVLAVMNKCLKSGTFPLKWKKAKLVLIPKPQKTEQRETSKYRPLCMLNSFSKLFERMIESRLRKTVEEKAGMSSNQYGFRKGKSTIDAVKKVMDLAQIAKGGKNTKKKLCAMVVFDVKNAFNTAQWHKIISSLRNLEVPTYLIKIIQSYLENRKLVIGNEQEKELAINMGVPQGSILGPLLWNVFYDDVLKIKLPPETNLVAYADDLALIVTSKDKTNLEGVTNYAIAKVEEWMRKNDLELAPEKTDVVMLSSRRKIEPITIVVGKTKIASKKVIKYLGIWLDEGTRMTEHINRVTEKANSMIGALIRLMTSEEKPSSEKRRILLSAAQSLILYGAPIWETALKYKKYKDMLIRCQRKGVIRTIAAYRTVSTEALFVVAGVYPIDLLVKERTEIYKKGGKNKSEERKTTQDRWQHRWETTKHGEWTRKLIPNVKDWIEKGSKQIDHYTTQFLTGHGCYRSYLKKIGKTEQAECEYCQNEEDNAEHILKCTRWKAEHAAINQVIGEDLTVHNFAKHVKEGKWLQIQKYLKLIMWKKAADERNKTYDA